MREIEVNIPLNTFVLTNHDIAVIHALAFYHHGDESLTAEASRIVESICNKLNMDNRILSVKVWR
jgi:hypothetical protein